MSVYSEGRHEHGQNFLRDEATISRIVDLVARTRHPIVEIGPGDGALTIPLRALGRPITAVEIDPAMADRLEGNLARAAAGSAGAPPVEVVRGDFLRHRLPSAPHVLVGNLPFHQTTAMLRRTLHAGGWTDAVLLTQWEVARRRAGVGGATMMTAQWWPWYEFALASRVPARHFEPSPTVDGGLMTITRRASPLVPVEQRKAYAAFVHAVFTGRGRGLEQVVAGAVGRRGAGSGGAGRDAVSLVRAWRRDGAIPGRALPKDLSARQWAELFAAAGTSLTTPTTPRPSKPGRAARPGRPTKPGPSAKPASRRRAGRRDR